MLRTFACYDMFAELLNRKHFRSAAAIFIDGVNAIEHYLSNPSGTADQKLDTAAQELDDIYEELSSMWKVAMTRKDAGDNQDAQESRERNSFRELMDFTVWNRASRSDGHRQFYTRVTGDENSKVRSVSQQTVDWFVGK